MSEKYLPAEWQLAKLGDVTQVVMGQSPPSETYNELEKGLPFLQGKAEFTELFPKPTKWCTMPLKIAEHGSVLISVRAPVGDVNLADQDYIIGRGLCSITITEGDNKFLFYSLVHNKGRIDAKGSGTTFRSINRATLDNFVILLPPLSEQFAIAHVLRAVQQAREARLRELTLERERKAALMEHLFRHGTTSELTKQTEIGEMPESWQVVILGKVAKVQGGFAFKSADYLDEGVPLLKISNVSFGKILWEDISFLPEYYKQEHEEFLLKPGDLVMAITRPIVSQGIKISQLSQNDAPSLLNQRVCRFINNEKVNLEYLFYTIHSKHFVDSIMNRASGSQQPNISTNKIENILIPLPPLSEQNNIAIPLNAFDARKIIFDERREPSYIATVYLQNNIIQYMKEHILAAWDYARTDAM